MCPPADLKCWKMLHVYLLRHGETAWNRDGNRYCGRTDLPLTEKGVLQAREAAENLTGTVFDAVYSSPLKRAFETARMAGSGMEVRTDPRLIELDFGNWEGKTKEEFIAENETWWRDWNASPETTRAGGTGETAGEVVARADHFFREVSGLFPDGHILVVGHNGLNRLYLSFKLGMPLANYRKFFLDNAAVSEFVLDAAGELTLRCLNGR